MTRPVDPADALALFSGQAPIFPLPNVVHFPHLLLPLHIFEPRYRRMVEDVLAGDRLLSMALLKPGWEAAAEFDKPDVFPMACLGRITAEQRLPDGRFYLVLQGLCRAKILSEQHVPLPYRVANLELQPDNYPNPPSVDRDQLQRELMNEFRKLREDSNLEQVFQKAVQASVSMGVICDMVADALNLPPITAQQVLETVDVDARTKIVLARIREKLQAGRRPRGRDFPPRFSCN